MPIQVLNNQDEGAGGILNSFLQNVLSGYTQERKRVKDDQHLKIEAEKSKLDSTLKLLEIQKKMQELEAFQKDQEAYDNALKASGVAPYESAEIQSAKDTAIAGINEVNQRPKINTQAGKLSEIYDKMQGYDSVTETVKSPGGNQTLTMKKKEKKSPELTASEDIALKNKIRVFAEKAHYNEVAKKLSQNLRPGQVLSPELIRANMSESGIMKFLKPAELYYSGNSKAYQNAMKNIEVPARDPNDPWNLKKKEK